MNAISLKQKNYVVMDFGEKTINFILVDIKDRPEIKHFEVIREMNYST